MYDERQLHLHSHVSMNNWNNTECIPVVPHYLTMRNFTMTYTTSGQD